MDLAEGELIQEIEKLDEGWWSGVGGNGTKSGLFPGGSHMKVLCGWFDISFPSELCGRNRTGGRA